MALHWPSLLPAKCVRFVEILGSRSAPAEAVFASPRQSLENHVEVLLLSPWGCPRRVEACIVPPGGLRAIRRPGEPELASAVGSLRFVGLKLRHVDPAVATRQGGSPPSAPHGLDAHPRRRMTRASERQRHRTYSPRVDTTYPLAFRGNTPQSCRLAEPDKLRVASRSRRRRTIYTRAKSLCQGGKVRNYSATAGSRGGQTDNLFFAFLSPVILGGHIVPSASAYGTNANSEKREKAEKSP